MIQRDQSNNKATRRPRPKPPTLASLLRSAPKPFADDYTSVMKPSDSTNKRAEPTAFGKKRKRDDPVYIHGVSRPQQKSSHPSVDHFQEISVAFESVVVKDTRHALDQVLKGHLDRVENFKIDKDVNGGVTLPEHCDIIHRELESGASSLNSCIVNPTPASDVGSGAETTLSDCMSQFRLEIDSSRRTLEHLLVERDRLQASIEQTFTDLIDSLDKDRPSNDSEASMYSQFARATTDLRRKIQSVTKTSNRAVHVQQQQEQKQQDVIKDFFASMLNSQ